ncbi:MAG TPA: ABC transporter permease [Solirubrobacterales bacterium]|nr:ABC transporter permease [Solirubrobacterales bacterium]
MSQALLPHPLFAGFGGAFEFIFSRQTSNVTGGHKVGGIDQVLELALRQIEVSVVALALAMLVAIPIGLYLGHKGVGEALAIGLGNASRAVPELAAIALIAAVVGVGFWTLVIVLAVLGIPPILTNTFTGINQVDRPTIDAARGLGMSEFEILRKVEVPMAVPSVMGGIRTSSINIIATATIAPLAGVLTLGNFIINENVYGANGVLAGAIVVSIIALIFEFALAGLQRRLTSKGLRLQAQ